MYHRTRDLVPHWLKVPLEPQAPAGAATSLRVFRAGRNFLTLRLWGWGAAQGVALAGIVFWTLVLFEIESTVRARRTAATPPPAGSGLSTFERPLVTATPSAGKPVRKKSRKLSWVEFKQGIVELAAGLPPWSFPLIWIVKIGGIALYLVQIPFTYAVRRLDYEMRWYIVTDRSLRIRTGIWNVQELTMSFANLQQVVVSQGPVQGWLGLADVRVQSAGGGGEGTQKGRNDSLHTAMFHSVDNASEIRDLILERLRQFRATGLGDPDDYPERSAAPAVAGAAVTPETLVAANELLVEARALRRALAR